MKKFHCTLKTLSDSQPLTALGGRPFGETFCRPLASSSSMHCTAVHCTAVHCTVSYCTSLHFTALHCTELHCTALHCTALHCTVLDFTALHCTALHCTVLDFSALYCSTVSIARNVDGRERLHCQLNFRISTSGGIRIHCCLLLHEDMTKSTDIKSFLALKNAIFMAK